MNGFRASVLAVALLVAGFVAADLTASGGAVPVRPHGESLDAGLLQEVSWNSGIYALAWSPEGDRLATGSRDSTVHIWDVVGGREVLRLESLVKSEVRSVAFQPDGSRLAAAYDDGRVQVWNLKKPKRTIRSREGSVATIAWSRDGKLLAEGQHNGTIEIRTESGHSTCSLVGHQDRVSALAWSAKDRWASGSWDGSLQIWNSCDPARVPSLDGHKLPVNGIAWSPDGSLLASGSSDDTVRVWNVETGDLVHTFHGHQEAVLSVSWSVDGQIIFSGSQDAHIRIWPLEGSEEPTLLGHHGAVHAVAVSPEGKMLASGSADGSARIWAVTTREEVLRVQGHASRIGALAFNRDGTVLAVGSNDNVIRTWNLEADKLSGGPGFLVLDKTLTAVAVRSREVIATGFQDGTVEIRKQGEVLSSKRLNEGPVLALAFRPDGKVLASGSLDRSFVLWDWETKERFWPEETGRDTAWSLAFSPDGRTLARGSQAGQVRLWSVDDLKNLRPIREINLSTESILSLAYPAANEVRALLRDGTIHRWDPASRMSRQSHQLPYRPSPAALSPDGHFLAWAKLGERIVRVEAPGAGGSYTLKHRLLGGSRDSRTWIACHEALCWRHDDGTLLLDANERGELSPIPPAQTNPQLRVETRLKSITVADGQAAELNLIVRNEGAGTAYWVRVRQRDRSDGTLIFHPPATVVVLPPGEEEELKCKVSVHAAYENPQDLRATLELDLVSADGSIQVVEPIKVVASTRWRWTWWIPAGVGFLVLAAAVVAWRRAAVRQQSGTRTEQTGRRTDPMTALKIWEEKLAEFQRQEAICSDPAKKYELKKQIEEAKDKIVQLKAEAEGGAGKEYRDPKPPAPTILEVIIVVIDGATGERIAGAQLRSDELGIARETDSDGRDTFSVQSGLDRLRLTVSKEGYQIYDQTINVFAGMNPVRIRLKPN